MLSILSLICLELLVSQSLRRMDISARSRLYTISAHINLHNLCHLRFHLLLCFKMWSWLLGFGMKSIYRNWVRTVDAKLQKKHFCHFWEVKNLKGSLVLLHYIVHMLKRTQCRLHVALYSFWLVQTASFAISVWKIAISLRILCSSLETSGI